MELILDIFIFAGRNGLSSLYNKGFCELDYNGFRYKSNDEADERWRTAKFPIWDVVQIESIGEVLIDNVEFCDVKISPSSYACFCIAKKDMGKLKDFCDKRNKKMLLDKERVYDCIDNNILDIAENLLNIIEEDILLNYRVVTRLYLSYSHNMSNIYYRDGEYCHVKDEYMYNYGYRYPLYEDKVLSKGKAKKEAEKKNDELRKKYHETSLIMDNFIEIIIEEKQIKEYIAKAVAWEAVQRKAIEYYAQKWREEYETKLEHLFDDFCKECMKIEEISIANDVKRNYIRQVLLCDEIDIEHTQEILMYYLLSKNNTKGVILCDCFIEHYEMVKEVKESVSSENIKNKLKTKQKRRISKYTIDDVDLMNGAEFEEFVGLLFKKMGYSSQVTKQSGDQGLDVIATKNGTKIGVQAKCYSNTVGNSAVQEAVGGKSFYNCDKVIVITNNYFTPAAEELAQSNGVILWNRDMLKEKIKELM